jgi:3-hydroxyisobutyrate dehydrogenase-like beta-hydroxyacid dehydrogenase
MAQKDRVGIIGPGRMGLAMVKHMVKKGYSVTATDISAEALKNAKAAGADTAPTAADVGKVSDLVIIAVGYDEETMDCVAGPNGLLKTMKPGSIIAVSSTVSLDTIRKVGQLAEKQGVDVYDAPICRGRWAADEGTLLALVGGKPEVVKRAEPVYACFCSDIRPLGGVGFGQFGKAMNNFLLWVNSIGLMEAGRMGESMGIDLPTLRDALLISSGGSQALIDWDMTTFTWAAKDMQCVSKMSDEFGLSLPIMGAIKELTKEARKIKATNPPDWTGSLKAGTRKA